MRISIPGIASFALIAALSAGAWAQMAPDVPPDLSGNSPFWIQDRVSMCWAANPHPRDNESIAWDGACMGGLLSGPGTLTWISQGKITGRDIGTFKDGRLSGKGRIVASDGTSYEGDFPGNGVLTLPDGRKVPARAVRDASGWAIEEPIPGEEAPTSKR
jgi:hypothetical protein